MEKRDKIGMPLTYIPMFHSNTRILEAYFYLVRLCKGDTPLNHPGIAGTIDTSNQMLAMECNPMCELNNTITDSPIKRLDKVLHMSDNMRNK